MNSLVFFISMVIGIVICLYSQKKLIAYFEKEDLLEKIKENNMNKLIVYQGIQGSGKSTAAKAFVMEDPDNRVRVNRDDIRLMLGKPFNPKIERLVTDIEEAALEAAMTHGKIVVSDNMNMNPRVIAFLEDLAKRFGYEVEYRFMYTPLEECIERDSKRPNPVGEAVIRKTYKVYKDFIESHNPEKQ